MVVLKQTYPGRFEALAGAMYIVLGWAAVVAAPQFVRNLPTAALVLVVVGGLLYTGGAVVLAGGGLSLLVVVLVLVFLLARRQRQRHALRFGRPSERPSPPA